MGQTLTWDLIEEFGIWFIRLYAGDMPKISREAIAEAQAFKEELARIPQSKRKKARMRFGISDTFITPRGRGKLRAVIEEVLSEYLEKHFKGLPGNTPGPKAPSNGG